MSERVHANRLIYMLAEECVVTRTTTREEMRQYLDEIPSKDGYYKIEDIYNYIEGNN